MGRYARGSSPPPICFTVQGQLKLTIPPPQICLWGNATDLSLLTSLSHEDIQALQSVERGANFLLKNDFQASFEHIKDLRNKRVDIVLDNSGFELVTDLALADWLVSVSPFCDQVVFHPKLMPWFVSDV